VEKIYQIKYLTDVDGYLDTATEVEQRKIIKNLKYLQEFGLRSEFRDAKKLKGYEFWEVRIIGKDNTRIFCYQKSGIIYILHIFRKKSNKTNKRDLSRAQKHMLLID